MANVPEDQKSCRMKIKKYLYTYMDTVMNYDIHLRWIKKHLTLHTCYAISITPTDTEEHTS